MTRISLHRMSFRKSAATLPLLGMLGIGTLPPWVPHIVKIEQNTRTVERQTVSTVSIGQGKTRMIWITGPNMDNVDYVAGSGGVTGTIQGKQSVNWTGEVQIILNASNTASRGEKTLSVHVSCPLVAIDCVSGPVSFKVRVYETGPITSINPTDIVTPNQQTTYTINGEGMNVAELLPRLTTLKNAVIVSKSSTSLTVSGVNPSCGGVDIQFIDVDGPEDMTYKKATGLKIPVAGGICGTAFATSPTLGGSTTAKPDLLPVTGTPLLRHIAQKRKLSGETFCNGMFAQAVQAIVKTITVPNMTWGVKNAGGGSATSFHVRLYRNGVLVSDQTVSSLSAGATKTFTYSRPESQTEVARLGLVPPLATQQLYQATGGECVQTVGQETQYDWQDPLYEIRVDPANAIAETSKTNNNKSF
ncbi:MAG TPA: CARDB domain-containing protein [Gemmatimonadaceae bacterium]|nr:CARDB domain-containing protein [Gemmatimonadaceae bacterium]